MQELSLFTGIGGGCLATKWLLNFNCIGYCENNTFRRTILKKRINEGYLDDAPIFEDVRKFNAQCYSGKLDIVTAGFPCQPFSVAGKQKAQNDPRNMWPETIRIIREAKPAFALLENVPGLLSRKHNYFETILEDLARAGYDARWRIISASEIGAPHHRKRLWILCNAYHNGSFTAEIKQSLVKGNYKIPKKQNEARQPSQSAIESPQLAFTNCPAPWGTCTEFFRMDDVSTDRVDRIKAIGNAQIPTVVAYAWRRLVEDLLTEKVEK